MQISKSESVDIRTETDVVQVRQVVRAWSNELKFSLVDQTKTVTAASELGRNTLIYGGGGVLRLEAVEDGLSRGLRLTFEDRGPGIADIELALKDGFTTGNGLGMGLSGSRRLMNEFYIDSKPGEGTKVTIVKWKGR